MFFISIFIKNITVFIHEMIQVNRNSKVLSPNRYQKEIIRAHLDIL
jgi:hypothetical protein